MKKKRCVLLASTELNPVVMLALTTAEIFANHEVIGRRSPTIAFLANGKIRKNELRQKNVYSIGWPTAAYCGFGENIRQTKGYLLETVSRDLKFSSVPFIKMILEDETKRHMLEVDMEEICKKFQNKPHRATRFAIEEIVLKIPTYLSQTSDKKNEQKEIQLHPIKRVIEEKTLIMA
ncbi:MAG: hypothetical protein US50_C0017G0015 [Candidatus Nomurabacteria bacterium GW2011_GWB1_37_5]|uniref:Uncharacterized protein n=1 Tax=Candidatus Nomurabacteria bacterium GW2011_GWB1_37_5 TaxID=1618742 RepID=A0A0G0JF10_9BACT|nr:MAG: hypothetical protein US50_C0017G0015 [Candidatus Nomurabacteria bacterium GW2011_GWB1_37_5]